METVNIWKKTTELMATESTPNKVFQQHEALVKQAATVSTDEAHSDSNPRVFLDVSIGGIQSGRIVIEVSAFKTFFRSYLDVDLSQ